MLIVQLNPHAPIAAADRIILDRRLKTGSAERTALKQNLVFHDDMGDRPGSDEASSQELDAAVAPIGRSDLKTGAVAC
ncbi:hypothetical protein D3C80_1908150 [compost metagenome]